MGDNSVDNTLTLARQLGLRVLTRDIEALNHAGFITLSASKGATTEYLRVENTKRVSKETLESFEEQPSDAIEVRAIFDHWIKMCEKPPRTKFTPRRAKVIRSRQGDFNDADLMRAIDGAKLDEEHWPDRSKNNDLTIIFRNPEQVEKFLAIADGATEATPDLSAYPILPAGEQF